MSLCGSDTEVSLTGCDVSSGLPRERDPAKCATSPMHTTTHTQSAALAPYLMAAKIVRQSLSCELIHARLHAYLLTCISNKRACMHTSTPESVCMPIYTMCVGTHACKRTRMQTSSYTTHPHTHTATEGEATHTHTPQHATTSIPHAPTPPAYAIVPSPTRLSRHSRPAACDGLGRQHCDRHRHLAARTRIHMPPCAAPPPAMCVCVCVRECANAHEGGYEQPVLQYQCTETNDELLVTPAMRTGPTVRGRLRARASAWPPDRAGRISRRPARLHRCSPCVCVFVCVYLSERECVCVSFSMHNIHNVCIHIIHYIHLYAHT